MAKTILLADDHSVVRAGLAALIEKYTPYSVAAETSDGLEAVRLARLHRPDLLVVDVAMPGLNGLEAVSQIRKFLPRAKILILSMHRNRQYVIRAIRLGAAGYLLKRDALKELVEAIERIMSGRRYVSRELYELVADELMAPETEGIASELEKLTARERQIVSLIAGGARRSEIAEKLHISPETVKTHRKNIMRKLHLHRNSELVELALAHHLSLLPSE